MEPITFLIGVIDLMIAYGFWMRTTKSYKFENVLQVAVNKNLDKKLSEVGEKDVIIIILQLDFLLLR